jgi:hypothetical protein
VGRIEAGTGLTVLDEGGEAVNIGVAGWDHFGASARGSGFVPTEQT